MQVLTTMQRGRGSRKGHYRYAMAVLAAVAVVQAPLANAAAPTPADALLPAINEADFEMHPPGQPLTSSSLGTALPDTSDAIASRYGARRGARGKHRRGKRPRVRRATRPGLVECYGKASLYEKNFGREFATEGYSQCRGGQTGGAADLLSSQGCIDVWSEQGRYWTRIKCGSWTSYAASLYTPHTSVIRSCTIGRYYRPVNKMSMVHGNNAAKAYTGGFKQCPGT